MLYRLSDKYFDIGELYGKQENIFMIKNELSEFDNFDINMQVKPIAFKTLRDAKDFIDAVDTNDMHIYEYKNIDFKDKGAYLFERNVLEEVNLLKIYFKKDD